MDDKDVFFINVQEDNSIIDLEEGYFVQSRYPDGHWFDFAKCDSANEAINNANYHNDLQKGKFIYRAIRRIDTELDLSKKEQTNA